MSDSLHPQIPLRLSRKPNCDFASFVALGNEQVVHRLQQTCQGEMPGWIYMWGAPSSGKSHLLQATCQYAEDLGRSVFFLAAEELLCVDPGVLDTLDNYDIVAFDGVHVLDGHAAWQEALFHFYNRMRDQGRILLVSAQCAPAQLTLSLPDLVSRLAAMEIYQLSELSDAGKAEMLRVAAKARGFALTDEVLSYILMRSNRDLPSLQHVIERLDHQSLQEKRVITIPFVKKVMSW